MQTNAPAEFINSFVGVVAALSLASERAVAVIKNVWPWLRDEKAAATSVASPGQEEGRRLMVTGISYVTSLFICYYSFGGLDVSVGPNGSTRPVSAFIVSLFALGGSAFWSQVVSTLSSIKDTMGQKSPTAPGAPAGPAPVVLPPDAKVPQAGAPLAKQG